MYVDEIESSVAVEFISKFHYSNIAQPGIKRYGWFDSGDNLVGVSIYNTGYYAMQRGAFGPEHANAVIHHHRLAISNEARSQGLQVSMFIGECNRRLGDAGYWGLITYADLDFDNTGTVYRATNAIFTGHVTKGNLYFVTQDNEIRQVSSALGKTWGERREEAKRRGWREVRSKGKYRYIYILTQSGNLKGREGRKYRKNLKNSRRALLRWPEEKYPCQCMSCEGA